MWLQSIELLLVYFAVFVVLNVTSQRVRFYPPNAFKRPIYNASSGICDRDSNCIPLRRCRSVRSMANWQEVSITCGSRYGMNRWICCPQSRNTPPRPIFTSLPGSITQIPPIARWTTIATEPSTSAHANQPQTFYSVPTENSPDCGQHIQNTVPHSWAWDGGYVREGEWPWMVAITMRVWSGNYTPWCTGFLIDRRHVLSAAHCFSNRDVDRYQTRIGNIDQTRAEVFPIARIVVPRGYRDGRFYDDLAILTLTREVNLPNVNPICLPDEIIINRNLEGQGTSIAGWGSERPGEPLSIKLEKIGQIPIVSNSECNRVFSTEIRTFRSKFPRGVDNTFICAGFLHGAGFLHSAVNACGEYSGAPLMLQDRNRWFAIGIVSFGISCRRPNLPGGYTRISTHLNWIRENTGD